MTDLYDVKHVEGGVPIKHWTRGVPVEPEAMEQVSRVARMPFVTAVALMPDVHVGLGATVGSVVATVGAVIPAAVGVDLGCGMMAVRTSLRAEDLPENLAPLRSAIEHAVPHGRTHNGRKGDRGAWFNAPPAQEEAWSAMLPRWEELTGKHPHLGRGADVEQLGTLGTGNHCITHFHGDHCLCLAGIVQRLSLDNCAHPVHVFYPASGQRFFERLRHASIFADVATVVAHPVDEPGVLMRGDGWTLSCLPLDHRVDTLGYRLAEDDGVTFDPALLSAAGVQGPAVTALRTEGRVTLADGRVVERAAVSKPRPGQVFSFVMDTRPCANAVTLARGADLAVVECTFHSEQAEEADAYAHMTSEQAGTLARQAGVKRLALTHFSQRYENVSPLLDEARGLHADTVALDDLGVVDVPKRARA